MKDLFKILDGIVDPGYEYTKETLKDVDQIMMYAESCGVNIMIDEAKKIQNIGKQWLNEIENGDGEWQRVRLDCKACFGK